jgi:hypothetical protein
MKKRYELEPGVNSVQIGPMQIGEQGYATDDREEQRLLDEYPHVRAVQAKPTKEDKE